MIHVAAILGGALLCALWAVLVINAGDERGSGGGRCGGCRRDEPCKGDPEGPA